MIKEIYPIPKFKKLDKIGKTIFVFSFLLPITIIYTFLHLYFLPFGLNKDFTFENKEVNFTNQEFFYTIDGEEFLDGVAEIKINPRIAKRNPVVTTSVQGEGTYIIPHRILNKDIIFNPEYQTHFNEDFEYALIQDYKVKDGDILVFKIEYDLDWETQEDNELLLKYKEMRLIQHKNSVELRVDKKVEEELKTYSTNLQFFSEDHNSPIDLYAIYKKPNETNGFLEIVAKNRISKRTIVPSLEKEHDEKIILADIETIWDEELEKDFSQEFISLKQEQYTYELIQKIPVEFRELVSPCAYYEQLHKPKDDSDCEETEEPEYEELDFDLEIGEDLENEESISLMGDGYFRYEEENPNVRYQVFYKKDFYRNFQGDITKISVGYEYPIKQQKEFSTLFPNTPIYINIVGENSKFEDLKINLFRESAWEKF